MKMYIDGAAADASNGEVIEVLNPATGELIDTVPSATQEDVSRAVTAAVAGEKAWAAVPLVHWYATVPVDFSMICSTAPVTGSRVFSSSLLT